MKIDFLVIVLLSACSASTYAQWQPSGATTGNIYYTGGRVGVGTSNPLSMLHINTGATSAVMRFQRDNANHYGFEISGSIFGLYDFTNSNYIWRTVGSNLALLETNGNVGIGTNGPTEKLAVRADNAAVSITSNNAVSNSTLRFRINESARDGFIVYRSDGRMSFNLDGANGLGSESNEYLTVLPNGSVGIGVVNPVTRFEVNGTISLVRGNKLQFNETVGGAPRASIGSDGTNHLLFHVGSGSGTDAMILDPLGNVGIGTTSPNARLHVSNGHVIIDGPNDNPRLYTGIAASDQNRYLLIMNSPRWTGSSGLMAGGILVSDSYSYAHPAATDLVVKGNVSIGRPTGATGYQLSVAGKAIAEEMVVQLKSTWPDYVFDSTYVLPPLSQVEAYIKANKHLPEIPSEAEVKENGVAVGEMNALLLKKIEELTLYVIEQNKAIEELRRENQSLSDKVEGLQKN